MDPMYSVFLAIYFIISIFYCLPHSIIYFNGPFSSSRVLGRKEWKSEPSKKVGTDLMIFDPPTQIIRDFEKLQVNFLTSEFYDRRSNWVIRPCFMQILPYFIVTFSALAISSVGRGWLGNLLEGGHREK